MKLRKAVGEKVGNELKYNAAYKEASMKLLLSLSLNKKAQNLN
jgi:hypothetical protein